MQIKILYAMFATNGWVIYYERNGDGVERAYEHRAFVTENEALLFGARNTHLLK